MIRVRNNTAHTFNLHFCHRDRCSNHLRQRRSDWYGSRRRIIVVVVVVVVIMGRMMAVQEKKKTVVEIVVEAVKVDLLLIIWIEPPS